MDFLNPRGEWFLYSTIYIDMNSTEALAMQKVNGLWKVVHIH